MKRFLIIVILYISASILPAQNTYEFLRVDMSPRAAALAGSFVASTGDPNVIFYNPAGISTLENNPVSFSFMKHLMDINLASLSYSQNIEGIGRLAGAVQYINYGNFDGADEDSHPTGQFGAGEVAFILGYGGALDTNFYYGANLKYIYSAIESYSSSGMAVDLGLEYVMPDAGWNFGISVLNAGGQLSSYIDTKEKLPVDLRIGVSKKMAHIPLRLFFGLKRLIDDDVSFAKRLNNFTIGAEINLSKVLRLRFGYDNKMRKDVKIGTSAGMAGFNFGLGAVIKSYNFDYAYSSWGLIGSTHRIGITTQL